MYIGVGMGGIIKLVEVTNFSVSNNYLFSFITFPLVGQRTGSEHVSGWEREGLQKLVKATNISVSNN